VRVYVCVWCVCVNVCVSYLCVCVLAWCVRVRCGVSLCVLKAHRLLLSLRSPVFHAQLYGHMREGLNVNEPIAVTDVTAEAFQVCD